MPFDTPVSGFSPHQDRHRLIADRDLVRSGFVQFDRESHLLLRPAPGPDKFRSDGFPGNVHFDRTSIEERVRNGGRDGNRLTNSCLRFRYLHALAFIRVSDIPTTDLDAGRCASQVLRRKRRGDTLRFAGQETEVLFRA